MKTGADDADGRLSRLEREAAVRRAQSAISKDFFTKCPPRSKRGSTASRFLVAERREGR